MNRLVGIWKNGEQARTAIEGATLRRVINRLPWLLVGLLGSMLATWIMTRFEKTLEERLVIAFFIPAIVYLADAIGTQSEAIAVRGLSYSKSTLKQLVAGELWTGILIGISLALFIFPSIFFVFNDARLALVVSLSVVVAGACASSIGLLFPWILAQLGKDPAYGSGPVATIVQDVLSLVTYFVFVLLLID
jgi:magnesium transporter